MSLIEKNIEALKKSQPELAESLVRSDHSSASERVVPTKDVHVTLVLVAKLGIILALHSSFASLKDA